SSDSNRCNNPLIQLNRLSEALPLVNDIRNRAARSTTLVFDYGANFNVAPYTVADWSDKSAAMRDLKWERRLELALEGSRFFDLVRWGDAATVMNQYYHSEAGRRSYYSNANFTAGKNEYLPIPQKQINYSGGLYQQNNGWDN
uniref:RagB/SusD family nutrient uptake outer membrane protein n=1 Tax=Bacteroides congonensis TaxID=1871006 RepID=UPI003219D96D